MKWFRWYRHTSENPKFAFIAKRASTPGEVVNLRDTLAVWCIVMEDASSKEHWGFCVKDADYIAAILQWQSAEVQCVLDGMVKTGLLNERSNEGYPIAKWKEYQYASDFDPTNKERQKRYYNRHLTHTKRIPNALVTRTEAEADTESEREEEKKERKTDAAVPAAEVDDPLDSAEDRFWKLVPKLSAGGIAKSRACQLLKLSDNDFEAVNRILADVLKAHVPSQYLGKIIANLKQERQLEVPMAHDPTLPDFAQGFKRDGYRIEYLRENRWKIGAEIYNEKGEVVGW